MVLADDNFAAIIVAVEEEGRKVFSNIKNPSIPLVCQPWLRSSLSSLQPWIWDYYFNQCIFSGLTVTDTLPAIALVLNQLSQGLYHKPRGRKSNFFDGGVFGAIALSRYLQTMLVLILRLSYPLPKYQFKSKSTRRCHPVLYNSWFDQLLPCL